MKSNTALQAMPREIPITPKSVTSFLAEVDDLFKKIEKRAFQLFEERGREDGRDWDDWFKAEFELLKAMPVDISAKDNMVFIRAEVPGFKAEELEINLEPGFVTIKGHHAQETESKTEESFYRESKSNDVFRKIALPFAVVQNAGEAALKDGVLEIKAPKAAEAKKIAIAAA